MTVMGVAERSDCNWVVRFFRVQEKLQEKLQHRQNLLASELVE